MRTTKTTGHIFIGVLAFLWLVAWPAPGLSAAEIELTTSNDIVSGDDDLYTAEIGLHFVLSPRVGLELGERIFTDRDRGSRFDESYILLGRRLPAIAGWHGELAIGALHVGEGVGGQSLQNAVHRVVGSDRIELAYIDRDRWYPALGLSGRKLLPGDVLFGYGSGMAAFVTGELDAAPGFRSSLRLALEVERPLTRAWAAHAELGLMASHVENELLDPHVDALSPAARLGLSYRGLSVEWSWNDYGTEIGHITIGYRVGVGRVSMGGLEALESAP